MHVCVIGGGIVGLATAWQLIRRGATVTLIERGNDVAREASYANGGQLSYDYVAPLADAGVLRFVPYALLRDDAALRLRPKWSAHYWRWSWSFLRRANSMDAARTTEALLGLGRLSRRAMADVLADLREVADPASLDYRENGKLVIYRDSASWQKAQAQRERQASLGSVQHALTAAKCIELEPALAPSAADIVGGIHTPTEAVIDGYRLAQAMARWLDQQPGFSLKLNEEVCDLGCQDRHLRALICAGSTVDADAFVVTSGVGAQPLLAKLGIALPILPLKGYSLTLPIRDSDQAPELSITDARRKIVLARLGQRMRIAGMVDLGEGSTDLDPKRLKALKEQARQAFPKVGDYNQAKPWAGLRPATPSGRPVIAATEYPNLWINAGHGTLGLTLAAGSAVLLADQVMGNEESINPRLFDLSSAA